MVPLPKSPTVSEICNGTVCTVDEIGNGSVGEIANGSVGEIANGSVAEIANGSVAEIPRRLRARECPEKRPGPVPWTPGMASVRKPWDMACKGRSVLTSACGAELAGGNVWCTSADPEPARGA